MSSQSTLFQILEKQLSPLGFVLLPLEEIFFVSTNIYFEMKFPPTAPIRQYAYEYLSDSDFIDRMSFHSHLDGDMIRIEMKTRIGKMVLSPALDYKDGCKYFNDKNMIVEECKRLSSFF